MRALRYEGPSRGVVLAKAAAAPEPPPGEALIRPRRVAISSTDLAIARAGGPGGAPITLGHEFVGVVERVTPPVPPASGAASTRAVDDPRLLVGKRVVGSTSAVCGRCDLCRRGLSNHCRERTVLGVHGRDGCFADQFCLPIANLTVVPDQLDDDHAVFAEPLASALHASQQVRIEGRPYVTVLGDGAIALLCAQVMSRMNASVRVLGSSPSRMALCERWGVKHRPLEEAGRRADQDLVIVCTQATRGLALALELVRPRGTVLLKSGLSAGAGLDVPVDLTPIVTNEIEIVGSRCGRISEAITVLQRGTVDVVSLITRRSKLDDGERAMRLAEEPEQLKVVMDV